MGYLTSRGRCIGNLQVQPPHETHETVSSVSAVLSEAGGETQQRYDYCYLRYDGVFG